jgi:hypothetical protein
MNELISEFVGYQFTPETIEDIKRSFELFEVFNNQDHEEKLIEVIMDSNMTSVEQKDGVYKAIHLIADSILEAHTIETYNSTSLYIKNEILSALFLVQHLEDSRPFQIALESNENDEEILAFIISELSTLEVVDVMTAIASFRPTVLRTLKEYLQTKEIEESIPKVEKYVKILKDLKEYTKRNDLLGLKLTESGMLLGQNLIVYASFIQSIDVGDMDGLAWNILSLLYMSPEGYNSPILAYRKYSHVFFDEMNVIGIVENRLAAHLANFNEYQKAVYEKNRLSKTSS